jgi:hypothetical protein
MGVIPPLLPRPLRRWPIRASLALATLFAVFEWPGLAQANPPVPATDCPGLGGQLLIAAGLLSLTTAVHARVTVVQLALTSHPRLVAWCRRSGLGCQLFVVAMVLLIALALLVEVLLWALVYWRLELFADFNASAYFSGSTFTTVGFSDLTLPECWRLLGVAQALNGVLMAGWSTALLVYVVQGAVRLRLQSKGQPSP